MNEHAFRTRNDWAELPHRVAAGGTMAVGAAAARADRAGCGTTRWTAEVPNPQMVPEWRSQWYGD